MKVEVSGSVPRFPRREIARFVERVLRAAARGGHHVVSIAFVDDATMAELNRRYRRKNRTTDVLTFDSGEPGVLGDIVISVDQARRQARDEKHSLPTEIRYLLVHGILHSLGYDHETDEGEMNALELRVRAALRLE